MIVSEAPPKEVVLDYPARKDGTFGPNLPQERAHAAAELCDELLYGGAAGGGKTIWIIAEVLAVLFKYPGATGVIFRRRYDQLIELGGIAWELSNRIPPSLGHYNISTRTWVFNNGSLLRLNYVARDADVTKFQGGQYAIVAFDQVEQFTLYQYTYIMHRLRVGGELAEIMERDGYRPRCISTANPAGVGHVWVKRRFIEAHPTGGVVWQPKPTDDDEDPGKRCFIPAKVYDNLDNLHPSYLQRLKGLPDPNLRRAMLDGDWDAMTGQKFSGFRVATHVRSPADYPMHMIVPQRRAMGIDYGMDAPFCALWGAKLPDGLIVVYRELYVAELTPEQQAQLILKSEMPQERTGGRRIITALDPSTWIRNPNDLTEGDPKTGAPPPSSIAGTYWKSGIPVTRANNNRIAGVARVHEKLRVRDDGSPRLIILDCCRNLIRILPELVADTTNPEDVNTEGEDHAFDALKYLLFALEPMNTDRSLPTPSEKDPRRSALSPTSSTGVSLGSGEYVTGKGILSRRM